MHWAMVPLCESGKVTLEAQVFVSGGHLWNTLLFSNTADLTSLFLMEGGDNCSSQRGDLSWEGAQNCMAMLKATYSGAVEL